MAKGYAQKHDIDYNETFTPISKMTIDQVLLVVATTKGWHLHPVDVENAFLQWEVEEQVYMGCLSTKEVHLQIKASPTCL